jgi:tetratricopeptide (TPR) repeat protein
MSKNGLMLISFAWAMEIVGVTGGVINSVYTTFGDELPGTLGGYIPALPMVALAAAELGRVPLASAIFHKHWLMMMVALVGIISLGYIAVENWTFGFERVVDLRLKPVKMAIREVQLAEAEVSRLREQGERLAAGAGRKREEMRAGVAQHDAGISNVTAQLAKEAETHQKNLEGIREACRIIRDACMVPRSQAEDARYAAVVNRLGTDLEHQREERKALQKQIDGWVAADAADAADIDRKNALAAYAATEARKAFRAAVATLCHRSMALWLLGYPDAALADANQSLSEAREVGHAVTLTYALAQTIHPCIFLGEYGTANVIGDELVALAEEKGSSFWKAVGMTNRGWSRAMTFNPSEATHELTVGLAAYRSTGSTNSVPIFLSALAKAHFVLRQFDEAWHCLNEAMTIIETTKEVLYEAEVNRLAGEIALLSPEPDRAKAQGYFGRAFTVARKQQAKSWELRAAMSIARLWRDQGKRKEARELLAPVYGWFTEGFDTLDLKEAKALLEELAA